MIVFNNQEFDAIKNITLAQFVDLMKAQRVIENTALLITVNNELITPSAVHTKMINDGDVIKTRNLPMGG
ncbi:hypothetical protein ACIZ62_00470 [Acetobacterium carbinolicum]|jgi:hypothetical protein|uniref:hypothetical protein n=1 Tax=Acetobacterium TaxID=33951 RepID=UPI000DBEB7C8|nr:hypothetical protein [Acetobacterium sp. KB-1]AWW27260.1 hypothetical protein DOZ58_11825 [Acetobacterium sp. KB-1]